MVPALWWTLLMALMLVVGISPGDITLPGIVEWAVARGVENAQAFAAWAIVIIGTKMM